MSASQILAFTGRPGERRVVVERWPGVVQFNVIEGGWVVQTLLLTEAEARALVREVADAFVDLELFEREVSS